MRNQDILKLLNEDRIEELKQKIIEEIGVEDNKSIPTYKAIQHLSKIAEKNQRSGKRLDGKYRYSREALAGAFYLDDCKTGIMDSCWALLLDGKIDGLVMAETYDPVRIDKFIPQGIEDAEKYDKFVYSQDDINVMKNCIKIKKDCSIELGCNKYPTQQLVNILNCLEDAVVYAPKKQYDMLVIKGSNGTGIICALRY